MEDLSIFSNESFDFVINPVSTCFTKNVKKVWKEVYRVLRPGAVLITGFQNPVVFSLDKYYNEKKELKLVHSIPYSEMESLSEEEIKKTKEDDSDCFEFGHSLSDLIGGQTDLGFKITGFYESYWGKQFPNLIDSIMPSFIATKAVK